MNILIVSHEFPPIGGGGATACSYLSKEFVRMGYSVTVVTSRFQECKPEEMLEGVHIVRIASLRKKKDTSSFVEMLSFVFSAYFYTDKLCRRETFDVCLVFFGIPSGPVALRLNKKYGIPYVVRFGGGDIPGAQKRYKYVYKFLNPITRCIWKNAKALVANSENLRDRASKFDDTNEIQVISNGVDSVRYRRITPYELNDEIRLLFVSRLIEGKGLQYIVPFMSQINEKAGRKVTLTIVGDGPYRETLENMIGDDNRELVIFTGRKENDELLKLYDTAGIFILPSLSEGMPNVVLEAMSMELPIIMTDCGGSKELIYGNGRVVTIDRFVNEIIEMCRDDDILRAYSRESGRRVKEYFSWNEKAKEYINLFNE